METTLSGRTLARRLEHLRDVGYFIRLIFLWTPNPEFSIERVAERVRLGGHSIPEETIRRRYHAGVKNLFEHYVPLADFWEIYDNTSISAANLVASGIRNQPVITMDRGIWDIMMEEIGHE